MIVEPGQRVALARPLEPPRDQYESCDKRMGRLFRTPGRIRFRWQVKIECGHGSSPLVCCGEDERERGWTFRQPSKWVLGRFGHDRSIAPCRARAAAL